jgi:hypothetical protein
MPVRILVAVGVRGEWDAAGFSSSPDIADWFRPAFHGHVAFHWVDAAVPLPEIVTVRGEPCPPAGEILFGERE